MAARGQQGAGVRHGKQGPEGEGEGREGEMKGDENEEEGGAAGTSS